MRFLRLGVACSVMSAVLAGAVAAWAQAPLVVATYRYPTHDRVAAIEPLARYLGRELGRPAETRLFDSPTALVAALQDGEVDIAVPNLAGFLADQKGAAPSKALAVPLVPVAQAARYRAVWLVRDGVGVSGLADLASRGRELRAVFAARDSASGALVPLGALRAAGGEPAFAATQYAGSHEAALDHLARGDVDVAGVAAEIWERSRPPGVREVWRSAPIPPGPLLCSSRSTDCEGAAAALLRAHQADPRVQAALNKGWPEFGDAPQMTAPDPGVYRPLIGR